MRVWRGFTRPLSLLLIAVMVVSTLTTSIDHTVKASETEASYEELIEMLTSYIDEIPYSQYISQYTDTKKPEQSYTIEACDYIRTEDANVEVFEDFEGDVGKSLYIDEEGFVEWEVDVKEAGLYNISADYYPIIGKSSDIQRSLLIDGALPFAEASIIEMNRFWANETEGIQQDNQGNDIRPRQVEIPRWNQLLFKDQRGYYSEAFAFYFSEGKHTVTLVAQREAFLLKSLNLLPAEEVIGYDAYLEAHKAMGHNPTSGQVHQIEAENAVVKSSPMLYPISDYSSPEVLPYSPSSIRINTIGGYNWRTAGQWIEWEVTVETDGFYNIGMNVKQNFVRGTSVARKLLVDGQVPFKEAENISYIYDNDWRQEALGGDDPYMVYLEAGSHRLRLEVILGDMADLIREVEVGVRNLNDLYRQIIMVTGVEPDQFRDYQLEDNIPNLAVNLQVEKDRLLYVADSMKAITGESGEREMVLRAVADQLDGFVEDVEDITFRLNDFKTNIGALGTWSLQMNEQPLQVDALYVYSPDSDMPETKDSFWDKLVHDIKVLFYSFIIDYNSIGNVVEEKEQRSITVWVGTGRDQANTMKSLIDETFTKETGIGVNLMLVDMATLLPATLSGQGPDVAMQVPNDLPMNYAMRGAVANLTDFEGYEDVRERFYPSAFVPYEFEGECYALPETQTFNMLFYRKDILEELDLEVPNTWDEVKVMLSVLSKNNMQFGMMPQPVQGVGTNANDLTYGIFLFQNGGEFYTEDGKASALDSDIAINAFKEWTKYYTDFTLDREFDFVNRFRTGEMPIGIADYMVYNTLQVSAPEIKGLWGFTSIPGTVQEDASVDRSVPSNGIASVIMNNTEDQEAAWEFLKWWTSADIQTKYGREMEGLMGAAARYPTANIEALSYLPWPVEDYKNISKQFVDVKGIPQVPGGYYTPRNIYNAFTRVVVDQAIGSREALMDNIRYINDEISSKREEFGLD